MASDVFPGSLDKVLLAVRGHMCKESFPQINLVEEALVYQVANRSESIAAS